MYLKIVHAVGERDHEARVVVDGLVTKNDVNPVVEIPEVVFCCRQLAIVILWVVSVEMEERVKRPVSRQ